MRPILLSLPPPRKRPDDPDVMRRVMRQWRRRRLELALVRLSGLDAPRPCCADVEAVRDLLRAETSDAT